jgi:cytidine diphosphoramidate kinase
VSAQNASDSAPVIWITGLSNAGKTTTARTLHSRLAELGVRPILLDGNQIRDALDVADGFDERGRRRMGFTYARLARMLSAQGHTVICATISLFHELHEWNRDHIGNYVEVLLDVPMAELVARDTRGVYRDGGASPVVGLSLRPEFPVRPDLVIRNCGDVRPGDAAERILNFCLHGQVGQALRRQGLREVLHGNAVADDSADNSIADNAVVFAAR